MNHAPFIGQMIMQIVFGCGNLQLLMRLGCILICQKIIWVGCLQWRSSPKPRVTTVIYCGHKFGYDLPLFYIPSYNITRILKSLIGGFVWVNSWDSLMNLALWWPWSGFWQLILWDLNSISCLTRSSPPFRTKLGLKTLKFKQSAMTSSPISVVFIVKRYALLRRLSQLQREIMWNPLPELGGEWITES